MTNNMEIIIGTYEEFLLGYRVDERDGKTVLVQSFADKSHSGSIRCVAVQGRWIATGATDDRIFIYDMGTRTQSQIILSHDGTINSLAFTPDGTHLLSAADDGRMIATRLKTWFTEANWKKAHSGAAVTHISCHPSGKLALSLGSDLVLRTWNLVKGRVAYKTNIKSRNTLGSLPDCLAWSPTGDYFTLSGQRIVEFWSIKTADVVRTQKTKSKPICLSWISDEACLVGLEDGNILWLTVGDEDEDKVVEITAHNARVKVICAFKQNIVTASSSGEIKLWEILEKKQTLKQVAVTNIGCRPTCLSVLDLEQFGKNYIISSKIGEEVKDTKPTTSKIKPVPRGVVTIEYDNDNEDDVNSKQRKPLKDDDDSDDEKNESNDSDDNVVEDDDDDDEDDSDENAVDDEDDEDGIDDNIADDDDDKDDDNEHQGEQEESSEDQSSDSDEDTKPEPAVRLSKSGKHKLQIQSKQQQIVKMKKQKLNSLNGQSKIHKQKQKQKNNKQKPKK